MPWYFGPKGPWAGVGFFPPGFSESWLMTPPFISRYDKRAAHGGGLAHFDPIRKGACDAWKVRWTCNEKDLGQTRQHLLPLRSLLVLQVGRASPWSSPGHLPDFTLLERIC
eukprot:symbB.v1.2.039974.t1/scaffold6910.1/size14648/2